MRPTRTIRAVRRGQKGYALLLVLFFLALLALGTIAATPSAITSGQRDKEEEMVWRGRQYVRGIRLYYQKTHRFPTQLEDLYKSKTGIRFMRQAYKDPMNPVDGSWRLIYVGPNGQLIGSLKPRLLGANGQPGQALTGGAPGVGTAANQSSFGNSSFGNSSFGNSSFGNSSSGNSSFGNSSFNNSSFGGNNSSFGSNSNTNNQQNAQNGQNPNDPNAANSGFGNVSTPQDIAPSDTGDTPTVIGGNIIGVGSKTNKASFLWFEKAKNYRQFEFVWDPSVDSLTGRGIGVPPPNAPLNGTSPIGNSSFSTGSPNNNMNGLQNSPTGNTPLQAPPQQ
jgi:uncharacterized membrane protein YgcG